jgi:ribosomal protein L14
MKLMSLTALTLSTLAVSGANSAQEAAPVAHITEVPVEKSAPSVEGHPLTSVVVTQCNLIVAVYLTMPDGRLLRFDKSAAVPVDQLMTMAYSATRSERVEVSCNDTGVAGYEKHDPV